MSTNCRDHGYPQSIWEEIGKLFNRYKTMTLSVCEHNNDDDDDDYEEHDKTRFRPIRRHNIMTASKTNEINSDDSLYNFMATQGRKSLPCAETGTTKKNRKCSKATCLRPNKGNRYGGNADTATASFYCSNPVQKTSRPAPSPHNRGSACNKSSVAECRCQCVTRTGNYGANDNVQCTSTRNYRVTDGQCMSTGKWGANNGQFTGATGNFGTNNNGCACVAAKTAVAAACLGSTNALDVGSCNNNTATLMSKVCRWAWAAADWTWGKTTNILVATVSFHLGLYLCDWCGMCSCVEPNPTWRRWQRLNYRVMYKYVM